MIEPMRYEIGDTVARTDLDRWEGVVRATFRNEKLQPFVVVEETNVFGVMSIVPPGALRLIKRRERVERKEPICSRGGRL